MYTCFVRRLIMQRRDVSRTIQINSILGVSIANIAVIISFPVSPIYSIACPRLLIYSLSQSTMFLLVPYVWHTVKCNNSNLKSLLSLESTMYSVFTTRIILGIRDIGSRTLQTELHTTYEESHPEFTPIRFAPHDSKLPQDCSGLS
jgi:hypothetical protein